MLSPTAVKKDEPNLFALLRRDRVLQLILLVAFFVRLSASFFSDFFVDETFTFAVTSARLSNVWFGLRGDSHPPLYYLSMLALAHLTRSVTILRLPSVLMSTLSILVYYRMFCRIGQRSAARLCAAIVAVSYCMWLTESEMRMYGMAELLTSLLLDAVSRCADAKEAESPGSEGPWVGLALVLLPSVHYVSALIQGLSYVFWLVALRRSPFERRLGLPMLMGILMCFGWIGYAVMDSSRSHLLSHTVRMHEWVWPNGLVNFFLGLDTLGAWPPWRNLAGILSPVLFLTSVGGWILLALGVRQIWVRGHVRSTLYFAFLISVCTLALMYGAYNRGAKWFQLRHLIVLGPCLIFFVATGLEKMGHYGKLLAGLVISINLFVVVSFPFDSFWWNQNWRAVARFVEARAQSGDRILAHHWYSLMGLDYCLWGGRCRVEFADAGRLSIDCPPDLPIGEQMPIEAATLTPELQARLQNQRFFLVLNQVTSPDVRPWFLSRFEILDSLHLNSMSAWGQCDVFLMQAPGARP